MRALISGGGIAGPALAWHLAKTGARITVVEKAPSMLPHGQNVDIQGTARNIIKNMGLMDEFRRYHTKEKGTQFIDTQGRAFAPFPVVDGASAASMTSEFEILRGDFALILYEATKDLPNVEYRFSTTVSKIVSNDDDSVKVELSNGETQEFDLLVAADGQWSKVRRMVFPPEDVKVIDKDMYVSYWTIPRLPGDNDWWNIYQPALPSRGITTRPDPHGTIRAMFTLMPCNDAQRNAWKEATRSDRQTQEDLVRKEFAGAGWQAKRLLDALETAPDFYFHPMQQVKMAKWSSSRIICLGDTAYAPSALTGMGTSLAITGAYVLAGELSRLGDGEHPAKAFEAYESKFRPFVEETQVIPWVLPWIAHPETALQRWLFRIFIMTLSAIVRVVTATPWLAKKFDGSNEEDYALPQYEIFGDRDTKSITPSSHSSAKSV